MDLNTFFIDNLDGSQSLHRFIRLPILERLQVVVTREDSKLSSVDFRFYYS